MSRVKRALLIVVGTMLVAGVVAGSFVYAAFQRNVPEVHKDIVAQFDYGSIGAEGMAGIPYWIWRVLPDVFADYLPNHPGKGFARLGFIFGPGSSARPIGTSYRQRIVPMIGLNCAACHVSTVRYSPGGARHIVQGMPAAQLDLEGYFRFLFKTAQDKRFTGDALIPAIKKINPSFSLFDQIFYRYFVIPQTRDGIRHIASQLSWLNQKPAWGRGRVDTFDPYISFYFPDLRVGPAIGTSDFPSLWNQRERRRLHLHWDGNNSSLMERNLSAAIGAGASPSSLDMPSLQRVMTWILDLKPPAYPHNRIDWTQVPAGQQVFQISCANCHAIHGAQIGQVTPIGQIGTDRQRLDSFTPALARHMNTLGTGYPWKFSHFRKTNGYANQPLDGIWLRGPYLHNGSVPTLRDLLRPPNQRPTVFYRGYDVYDFHNIGFISQGAAAKRAGTRFDTRVRGNGNAGHTYGVNLSAREKQVLLEYLKTL